MNNLESKKLDEWTFYSWTQPRNHNTNNFVKGTYSLILVKLISKVL